MLNREIGWNSSIFSEIHYKNKPGYSVTTHAEPQLRKCDAYMHMGLYCAGKKKNICINFSDISYTLRSVNLIRSKKKKNHYLCGCMCEVLCHPQYVILRQPIYNPLHTSILLFIFKNVGGGSKIVFYLIYPLLCNLWGLSEALCVLKLRAIYILYTGYSNIWTIRESLKSKFNSNAN